MLGNTPNLEALDLPGANCLPLSHVDDLTDEVKKMFPTYEVSPVWDTMVGIQRGNLCGTTPSPYDHVVLGLRP